MKHLNAPYISRIGIKLLFWFIVISMVPLSVIGVITYSYYQKTLKEKSFEEFYQIAGLKERQIVRYFTEHKKNLNMIAHSHDIVDALVHFENAKDHHKNKSSQFRMDETHPKTFHKTLQYYASTFGYADILLFDKHGNIVYSLKQNDNLYANLFNKKNDNPELERLFDEVVKTKKSLLSNYRHYGGSKQASSFLMAPIFHGQSFIGVVMVRLKVEDLFNLVNDVANLGKTGEVLIDERDSNRVVFICPLRFDENAAFKRSVTIGSDTSLTIQYATAGKSGSGFSVDYRGKNVFAVWEHIPLLNWVVVVKKDKKELLLPIDRMKKKVLLLLFIFFSAIIVLAFYLSYRFSKPVKALQLAIKKVAKGDLNQRVISKSKDEIGMLAREFNEMTVNFKTITASRDTLNEEIKQRKEAEEQNKILLRAIEQNPVSVIITDKEGLISYVNKKFELDTGYSSPEVIGKKPNTISSGLTPASFYTEMWATLFNKKEWKGEIQNKKKDGGLLWHSVSVSPILNDAGEITHFVSTQENITERKKWQEDMEVNATHLEKSRKAALSLMQDANKQKRLAEIAVQKLEGSQFELQKLANIVHSSEAIIISKDMKGVIQSWNMGAELNYGYTADEIFGKSVSILLPKDMTDEVPLLISKIKDGETVGRYETRRMRKDGSIIDVSLKLSPIRDLNRKVVGVSVIGQNITDLKETERALKESEEKTLLLLNSTAEAIYGIDLNGDFTFLNNSCLRMLGYEQESDLIGNNMHEMIHGRYADGKHFPVEKCRIYQALKQGKEMHVDDEVFWKADGSNFPVEYWSHHQIHNGKVVGSVVTFIDITERKFKEQQLNEEVKIAEEATRSKSLFLANMSHEIRTPMNAILGFTEILSRSASDPIQKDYIKSMQSSGKALLNLLNDLLDFSKAEAGKMEINMQAAYISYIVSDIESIFRMKAHQKNLDFIISIAPDVPDALYLDELKIRQILLNLISNAIKFTEKGFVKISIKAESIGKEKADLLLEVEDSGKGIPPEFHEKIFKLFEQQDSTISNKYGGTGLGLAITMQIVRLMGGYIELKSEEGKGSTFMIHLPGIRLLGEKTEKKALKAIDPEIHFSEPATLLIVDDTPYNRVVLKALLEDYPFTFLEAENGKQALEIMEHNPVDLVFMDIRMPVMSGIEAIKIIREHAEWTNIPVIALTASSTKGKEEEIKKEGFNAFVLKPATMNDLVSVLSSHLKCELKDKTKTGQVALTAKALEQFPQLMADLNDKITPLQQSLATGIRPRQKVREMGKLLVEIGRAYHTEAIQRYGEELLAAAEHFLLEKEKAMIVNFSNFVEQLNLDYHEKRK